MPVPTIPTSIESMGKRCFLCLFFFPFSMEVKYDDETYDVLTQNYFEILAAKNSHSISGGEST